MLILAGVSINAVVGDNGVLTKAKDASIASKKASILEAIDLELASYNIDTILNNPEVTTEMLKCLKDKGLIDTVLSADNQTEDVSQALGIPNFDENNQYTGYTDYGVMKDDYSIILSMDLNGIYKAKYGEVNLSAGGSVAAGTTVVTSNAFNSGSGTENPEDKGKFTIDNDASVMFVDEINGELSILVKSGTYAKVNIFKDMTLTNAGVKRSAIDIEPGGTLDLYVAEGAVVTVNSGLGEDASGAKPGKGGYAGIHVPSNSDGVATLNLKGKGKIIAIGGNAGGAESSTTNNIYNAGGGGAGAGIGGNGGNGASGANGQSSDSERVCESAGLAENCGNVNIYNSLKVYAYGGGGGYGGTGIVTLEDGTINDFSGGGGGYPAAGIGGGGAGGAGATCCTGAGGYTGGASSSYPERTDNGIGGGICIRCGDMYWGGGGYFQGQEGYDLNNIKLQESCLGGMGGTAWYRGHRAGDGGTAGKGGNIKVSNNAEIYAFNGNIYTDGTDYQNGINQCPIYLQSGIKTAKYDVESYGTHKYGSDVNKFTDKYLLSNNITLVKTSDQSIASQTEYVNTIYSNNPTYIANKILNINTKLGITTNTLLTNVDMSKQGIGSGAGYIELSNGTYTVDESMN